VRLTTRREVYRNKWLTLFEDRIERSNGAAGIYAWIDKPPFAVVIPFDGTHVTMIRQFRYPNQRWSWEFPSGAVEGKPELTAEEIARQELREETGLLAGRMTALGKLAVAPGFSNQEFTIFLAEELEQSAVELEEEEADLTLRTFTREQVRQMCLSGEITDSTTVTAMYFWQNT